MANHVWQSTLFAAIVWVLALALRQNRAAVRYRLWMAASLKFLIPFAVLERAGGFLSWRTAAAVVPSAWSAAAQEVLAPSPIGAAAAFGAPTPSHANIIPLLLLAAWIVGSAAVLRSWWREWRPIREALRRASPSPLAARIAGMAVMSSPDLLEPGIVGIWRPVLLLPDGIADRLPPAQLNAIVAHERCHHSRRDNLTAAIHMFVEAVFWFHPAVWWIETRLVEERERACDEAVLAAGNEPQTYAEAILSVCRYYVESPLISAAGVTGANLKRRVEAIMRNERGHALNTWKRSLLAAGAVLSLAVPVAAGAVHAPGLQRTLPPVDRVERPSEDSAQIVAPPATPSVKRAAPARRARAPIVAPADGSTITGIVTDESFGQPIAGVAVEVKSDVPGQNALETVTDATGAFKVTGLPAGVYSVTLAEMEYTTFKREGLIVRDGATAIVHAALKENRIRD